MKTVEDYEQIRRAFFVEGLSIREIHRPSNTRGGLYAQANRKASKSAKYG